MDLEPVWRIALAALMSVPIGLDRELHGKAAGLRTHLLLATATAALGYLSVDLAANDASADPTRIASYVVAGIGFIGAGLIVGVRGRIYGLTTAAAAFSVMAIGVLNGTGYALTAGALTGFSVLALWPIEWLKPRTYGRFAQYEVTLHLAIPDAARIGEVLPCADQAGVAVRALEIQRIGEHGAMLQMTVRGKAEGVDRLVRILSSHGATDGAPVRSGAGSGDSD